MHIEPNRHLGPEDYERLFQAVPLRMMDHLLTCAFCRRRLAVMVSDLLAPPSGGTSSAGVQLVELVQRVLREVTLTLSGPSIDLEEGLFQQLLQVAPDVRPDLVANDGRFGSLNLAYPLIDHARSLVRDHPKEAQHFASLVITLVERLDENSKARRVYALACSLLAEAQRVQGWLDVADDFLRDAAASLQHEPLVIPERIELSRQAALLRKDQNRIDEAMALLERASFLSEELAEFEQLGHARLALGWMLLGESDPGDAIAPLREALALLHTDPHLAFSALHALCLGYAELGEDDRLDEAIQELDSLGPLWTDPLDSVRVRWVVLQATWRQDAEKRLYDLHQIFEQLAESAPAYEAATAGLELARTLLELEADNSSALILAIRTRVQTLKLAPYLLRAVLFALDVAAHRLGAFQDALLSAIHFLERARFNAEYLYYPTPEPESSLHWTEIPPHHLRDATALVNLVTGDSAPDEESQVVLAWILETVFGIRPIGPVFHVPFSEEDDTTRF